ncbi:MAG: response regulator [Candidatus Hinthialibacter antarcticus]|nr:response regulator [Candidatus Hinthialibacter antarcticus]
MSNLSIMVVEDEEELRENLTDLLEFKGHAVTSCSDGEQAVAQFERVNPQLVLLDIQLPGINGLEVLRTIKAQNRNTPVVIVSASSAPSVIQEAKSAGAYKIILKPYDHNDILRVIDEITASGANE